MLKRVEITTKYGSKMLFSRCLFVNFKTKEVSIIYEHSDYLKEQSIKLNEIADVKISILEDN